MIWDNDYAVKNAVDFWYKAGYSSSEGVWSKKQEPVCQETAAQYLVYDDTDDEDNNDEDDDEKETDYKRKIRRKKERHDHLKAIHIGMDKVLESLSRKAGQDNFNDDE